MTKKECALALQESKNLSKNKANNTMTFILKHVYENILTKGVRKTGEAIYFYNKGRYEVRILKVKIAEDSSSVMIKYFIALKRLKSKEVIFKFKKEYTFDDPRRVRNYIKAKEKQEDGK